MQIPQEAEYLRQDQFERETNLSLFSLAWDRAWATFAHDLFSNITRVDHDDPLYVP
jgi:hypothetical protein